MKIKIGPIEVEQDPIKDEILYEEYKNSPKAVEKYLLERSKSLDLTLKNILDGKTMKMIRDFIFTLIGGIGFISWSIYVFYVSKDMFTFTEMNLETVVLFILQALLIIWICFLPVMIVSGIIKSFSLVVSKINKNKNKNKE